MTTSLIRSNKYMQDTSKGPGAERGRVILHHFPGTFFFFFSIRYVVLSLISYLVLPGKKVPLGAWNFPIRDSVLGFCGLLESCLKRQMGISEYGPELTRRLPHFSLRVLWPRGCSWGLAFLPISCFLRNRMSVFQFENPWAQEEEWEKAGVGEAEGTRAEKACKEGAGSEES